MATATDLLVRAGWEDHGGVLVNPEAVRFRHAERGTCVPECPWYGLCHDFCGQETAVAERRWSRAPEVVPGRPYVYRRGHHVSALNRGRGGVGVHGGSIPHERVRPLLEFLERRYPTRAEVARILGMHPDNYRRFRVGYWPTVQPRVWRRIQAVVLAHRRPVDPWRFEEEVEVRVIPDAVRRRMDLDEQNERKARWRHGRRAT